MDEIQMAFFGNQKLYYLVEYSHVAGTYNTSIKEVYSPWIVT